ncbi:hypothetical protein WBG78_13115 [Chryseolinea sp. T2]|uniref:hypothetical protein n=1 Tax=Chryseolinea sp. T2 TaxID=3129255 RepID=UPI0030784E63
MAKNDGSIATARNELEMTGLKARGSFGRGLKLKGLALIESKPVQLHHSKPLEYPGRPGILSGRDQQQDIEENY